MTNISWIASDCDGSLQMSLMGSCAALPTASPIVRFSVHRGHLTALPRAARPIAATFFNSSCRATVRRKMFAAARTTRRTIRAARDFPRIDSAASAVPPQSVVFAWPPCRTPLTTGALPRCGEPSVSATVIVGWLFRVVPPPHGRQNRIATLGASGHAASKGRFRRLPYRSTLLSGSS